MGMTTEPVSHNLPRWTFADRIRKIRREQARLSQAAFAARLGVGDKAYAAWETGSNNPGDIVGIAQRIEHEFGVPAAWTLGLMPDTQPGPRPGGRPDGGHPAGPDPLDELTRAKRRRHARVPHTRGYPKAA